MKKIYLFLVLSCLSIIAKGQTSTFGYTGSVQIYTVPVGVNAIGVDVQGAKGGDYPSHGTGGSGGRVQATLTVTSNQLLYIYVGNVGNNGGTGSVPPGGSSGGGGEDGGSGSSSIGGAAGGAASDIRLVSGSTTAALASRIVVAGGGGAGAWNSGEAGGPGGGLTGGNGFVSGTSPQSPPIGGTQTAGGPGQCSTFCGSAGGFGNGGNAYPSYYGGGGGGGWYGGGGAYTGSGGGGSSYPATTNSVVTALTHTQGYNAGVGKVIVTVLCSAPGAITGTQTVCAGSTTALANTTGAAGGTWSVDNTTIATISSAGVLTGVSPGTATVTYNVGSPCGGVNATAIVTVNAVPSAITGNGNICVGLTQAYSSSPSGGTWTSSNTAQATVTSLGVATGVAVGTPTISYSLGNGCAAATRQVTINALPAAIGGAPFVVCGGQTISLTETTSGGTWSINNSSLATISSGGVVGGVAGGIPIVTYTTQAGCIATTPVTVNFVSPITGAPGICAGYSTPLSDATGGGNWTSSNTAVATISSTGTLNGVTVGAVTITYTVPATGCYVTQLENVTIVPASFAMTGGGSFCSGPSTVHVGINGSNSGVAYQLVNTITGAVGSTVTGTGFPIDFGVEPAGTYYVVANPGSPCSATMSGTVTVTAIPLPTAFAVTGGGGYCPGGNGTSVSLTSSTIGTNYQLYVGGVPVGTTVAGTGSGLNFGLQTTAGTYTVIATNASTGCSNTMSGNAVVSVNPAPAIQTVTGGGQYCVGGTGVHIGLASSVVGTNYQLTMGGSNVGSPVAGTGSAIDFGLFTTAGVYNVVATIAATGCTATMSGTGTVVVNSLPTVFNVTGGGGYCATTTNGVTIGINGSTIGVNYQLYYTPSTGGTTAVGSPVAGTGSAITFTGGTGTGGTYINAGSYSVVATNPATSCTNNMFGSVSVFPVALPAVFTISGGTGYCAGGTGPQLILSGSVPGTTYQLFNGATLTGAASGTGSAINFGSFTTPGTYSVIATQTTTTSGATTTCSVNMSGTTTVSINALPTVFTVGVASGSICAGTTTTVNLSGSQSGVNYQLFNGSTPVTPGGLVAGTGSAITFPSANSGAGSYTVVATNATTSCTSNMTGSAIVTANPIPTFYSVTGGGNYCANATTPGVLVGLGGSNTGISYTLYKVGGTAVSSLTGVGGALNFGLQSVAGTYKIAAQNTTTGCADTMSGSAVVGINAVPNATYNLLAAGGAQYCFGGTGVAFSTSNSESGVNYQLSMGGSLVGSPVAGISGVGVTFAPQTAAGTYTVVASNATTGCSSTFGSLTVTINPLPTVASVTGGGAYCGGTTGAVVGLSSSQSGVSYTLMNGSTSVASNPGTGSAITFGPQLAGTYTVVATNGTTGCSSNMSGSAVVTLNAAPVSSYVVTGGGAYCAGGTGVHIGLSSSNPGINYQLTSGGSSVGAPVAGTGLALDFGLVTAGGTYTVVGTNVSTGCSATMTGSTVVSVSAAPTTFTVTGGGPYCPGTSGVLVGLSGSSTGTSYQLYNGSTMVGATVAGTGSPINFGLVTGTGTYTVIGNNGCSGSMTGSVNVSLYSLPVAYSVTGGGSYCPGGTGVTIGLSGSTAGVHYQLQNGAGLVGSPVTGTGFSLTFPAATASGTYTIVATGATGCTNTMAGNATVTISTPPTVYNVTGGGNYCQSASGVHIGLNGSMVGTTYQLYNSGGAVGSAVPGTGSALDLGAQTAAGTYTVMATSGSTTCTSTMAGSTTVAILPLPSIYTVSTGGSYCAGGSGIDISLSSTTSGVSYQLFNGATPLTSIVGAGSSIDFGTRTAGNYTIVATDPTTNCSATMSGTSAIVANALPTAYVISGGGNYCAGGTGVHVTLSGSNTGINYQVMVNGLPSGSSVSGTGSALDLGLQTLAGTYTVMATNAATGCTNLMTGSVPVVINAVPASYSVTASASNYCAGDAGVDVSLSGSDAGIQYQLYNGTTTIGTAVSGTGFGLDFGMQTMAGTYTVVAMNGSNSCNSTMAGAATIVVNPLPIAYTVTGGGSYCAGGAGTHVGISGSNTGISYQLYNASGTPVGSPIMGTGLALDFGPQTAAGNYTVIGTNVVTTCTKQMSGAATITIAPLPTVTTISGGGSYCAGGTGVHIGLNGSTAGVNYQLYNGVTLVGSPVAGTGIAIDFGPQTAAGTYSVIAHNAATSCSSNMAGTVTVTVNSLPSAFPVIGGGNYCPGGAGVHVGLGSSAAGISYQLYNGSAPSGSAVVSTGGAVDFGARTGAGTYTVIATNPSTGCTSNMSGTVNIGLNPLPAVYSVIGGGSYCAGADGVHVGLNGSAAGVNYQLYNSGTVGFPIAGTGGPIDFGAQTAAGSYTVVATSSSTTCTSNMTGSATVVVNPTVVPSVTLSTGIGDTVCAGRAVTISTTTANAGTSATFSWMVNGAPVSGTGSTYSYIPTDHDVVSVSLTSSATCATPATVGSSLTLSVLASGNPTISVAANPGSTICAGTEVTFNSFSTLGGTNPTFTWIVNGSNVSNASSYSYTPTDGDVVYAIMTSNYQCRLENTVTSNHITMAVAQNVAPTVTITARPGTNLTKGESATFTANVANGGLTPTYQWFVNGVAVPGAIQSSYTNNNFNNGDSVTCEVISSGGCAGLIGFNSVRLVVSGSSTGVQQVVNGGGDIQLLPNPNKGAFTVKGTLGTTDNEEVTLELTNMLGQVIYSNKVMTQGGNINERIQLNSSVANGMYILNLRSASANNVFHVVIEQ